MIMKHLTVFLILWLPGLMYGMHLHAVKRLLHHARTPKIALAPSLHKDTLTILCHATEEFRKIPGYGILYNNIYKAAHEGYTPTTKGYIYELLVAWHLQHHGHIINSFNYTYEGLGYTRQFDIVTDQWAVECKNIEWPYVVRSDKIAQQLERQFCEQRDLVDANLVDGLQWYVMYSYNPIPPAWKEKLRQQRIMFMQGPY